MVVTVIVIVMGLRLEWPQMLDRDQWDRSLDGPSQ